MKRSGGARSGRPTSKNLGENVVRIEAEALRALADRLAGPMAADFERAVELLYCCAGRIVVTGMGKSGLIARKIAATSPLPEVRRCFFILRKLCTATSEWWSAATWLSPSRPAEKPTKSCNCWKP